MGKIVIKSIEDFLQHEGELLGVSDWIMIDQSMINRFADATLDHQWVHVDEERARKESSSQTTIVQGYFLLSLLVHLLQSAFIVEDVTNIINYSVDNIIFRSPVKVNSRVRLHVDLPFAKEVGYMCQTRFHCVMEVENQEKSAMEGQITFLYNFEK